METILNKVLNDLLISKYRKYEGIQQETLKYYITKHSNNLTLYWKLWLICHTTFLENQEDQIH